jgi:hypothetical protein
MSKVDNYPELESFLKDLTQAGFEEDRATTLYRIFDGDEVPENSELHWREAEDAYQTFCDKHMLEVVAGEGGTGLGGEHCWGVIRIGDKYFRADWSYYYKRGCKWDYIEDTIQEVKPVEKVIIVYEKV